MWSVADKWLKGSKNLLILKNWLDFLNSAFRLV